MRMFRRLWLKLLVVVLVSLFLLVMGGGGGASQVDADGPFDPDLRNPFSADAWEFKWPDGPRNPFAVLYEEAKWLVNKDFGGQDARVEDMVGCWVSGETGSPEEASWNSGATGGNEFAAEVGDGYSAEVERSNKLYNLMPVDHENYFDSVRELVDYTFALDIANNTDVGDLDVIDDERVKEVKELVWGSKSLDKDSRKVPWGTIRLSTWRGARWPSGEGTG